MASLNKINLAVKYLEDTTPMGVGASNTYGMLVVMRNNIASSSLKAKQAWAPSCVY
jgi:hypothetical protein